MSDSLGSNVCYSERTESILCSAFRGSSFSRSPLTFCGDASQEFEYGFVANILWKKMTLESSSQDCIAQCYGSFELRLDISLNLSYSRKVRFNQLNDPFAFFRWSK